MGAARRSPRFSGPRAVATAVFAVLAAIGALWGLASPVNGVPDERAHLVKAAGVALGEPYGMVTEQPDGVSERVFAVPPTVAEAIDLQCHRFVPSQPASSCPLVYDQPLRPDGRVDATTGAADYNPAYYALAGWPLVLLEGFGGIYAARFVSAVIVAAFFALAAGCVSMLPRRGLPLAGVLMIATPAVMQYAGSVNPQAFEVASLTAFTAALFTTLRLLPAGSSRWALLAVLVVSGGLGAQARALSWAWIGCIVLVALCWAGWSRFRRAFHGVAGIGAVAVVALASAFASGLLLTPSFARQQQPFDGAGTPPAEGFLFMLSRTFEYWNGMFGLFAWNDIVDYWSTYIHGALLISVVLAAIALTRALPRQRAAVTAAALMLALLPALIQSATVEENGYIWQGRYALPLYALLVLVAVFTLQPGARALPARIRARLTLIFAIALGITQFTGFVRALTRNYIGFRARIRDLFGTPAELGEVPVLGNELTLLAIAVFAASFGLLVARACADGAHARARGGAARGTQGRERLSPAR